ncbi:MAG: hypothetical protein WCE58_05870, partial [Gallionella sp.]
MNFKHQPLFAAISCSFYALTLCWFAYAYRIGAIDRGLFFNSDALFFPSFFKNIFLEGKHFADWVLPPSSYLFPDALLYAIAYILSKNVFNQILIFAILQSLLFFYLISALLGRFIRRSDAISYSALICSNVILLGLYSADPFGLSFIDVFHFGSLLSFLMLSILLLKFHSAASVTEKYLAGALAVLLATCSAMSDRLILIQFIAPILLIGIYNSYIGSKSKRVLEFAILLIFGYVLALILGKIFLPEMGSLEYGIGLGSISDKSMMFVNWVRSKPVLIQLSLGLLPITLYFAILSLHQNGSEPRQYVAQRRLFALLILVSVALTLLATGLSNRDFTPRYLLPFIFLPPVFLFILLSERKVGILALVLCVSSCLAIFASHRNEKSPVPFYSSYPEFVRCIDALAQRHHVSRGMAQYWDAIPLDVFSDVGLEVVPVIDDGSPMRFAYNNDDFSGKFAFAVIDNNATGLYKLSRTAIEQRLANRPFEYQCYDKTVLIFNNEAITLPKQSALSDLRSSALESFVKNPRALLIMAQEESKEGNHQAAARLLT